MEDEADTIAGLVFEQFDGLPAKRKPTIRDNGLHEWVPLCGIVAKGPEASECLSLATGMKCLPAAKIPQANGVVIHDWHAETLAIRCFNHFLLGECKALASGLPSRYLRRRNDQERPAEEDGWHGQPFAWKDDVTLHMYCSEAPCGDASMELTMADQEDASPWEIPPSAAGQPSEESLPGRAFFSQLGVVRRKPGRGDAPASLSKSCSDKLALRQCTSLLSSITSLLVHPGNVYLRSLVIPESRHSAVGCARCFSAEGRMQSLAGSHWPGGYHFLPFTVLTTAKEFRFSNREVAARSGRPTASNLAAAWSMHGLDEGLIGGALQGRKQFDVKGASLVSRRKMWEHAREVAAGLEELEGKEICEQLDMANYHEMKVGPLLAARKQVKQAVYAEALKGWMRNAGDDDFGL